ncbi:hypothetical protein K469DRAFT_695476 [Zopfia rhizophila CBS 207.26]|uniref:F-box domain-containing protein n=1 Tax=Zopfia rhizophila CBS 207.26 TaxID=1314779 RepID=A0A6A6DIZ0_9PEZI|nr:hypothetical protein K469DRAFT_695476 [Zopfia rhizophila CBS 207.26]
MDRTGDFQFISPTDYTNGEVPWCLQPQEPPPCLEAELSELQLWTRDVLDIIDHRVASYESHPNYQTKSAPKTMGADCSSSAGSRVARIAELLEEILRYTNTVTHLVALGVCKKWKDIAVLITKPSTATEDFTLAYPCPPVKFGDLVPQELRWLEAPAEEFEYLNEELDTDLGWTRDGIYRGMDRFNNPNMPNIVKTICYPARITQAPNATSDQIYGVKFFYHEQLLWSDIETLLSYTYNYRLTAKWVDVTQFKFNPYFTGLFQDSFEIINGLSEITLQPSSLLKDGVGWHNLPKASTDHLNSQFVTQPPIISLNISTWIPQLRKPRVRKALHIINVKNDGGIRTGELISAMKSASHLAIEHWIYQAKQLRTAVAASHWEHDVWVVDGAPKLLLSLDPFASGEERTKSLYYLSCMHALPGRDERQAEWMPRSMFRHARRS